VSTEREKLAMPLLYGAPPHGPRRMATVDSERPTGPDDLPMERYRSAEDHVLATELFPRTYTTIRTAPAMASADADPTDAGQLKGRPLVLRALAGRLIRPRGTH